MSHTFSMKQFDEALKAWQDKSREGGTPAQCEVAFRQHLPDFEDLLELAARGRKQFSDETKITRVRAPGSRADA